MGVDVDADATTGFTPPRLTDGVVVLRLVAERDAPAMTAGLSEEGTVRWFPSLPHPWDPAETTRLIRDITPAGWRTGTELWLAIANPATDEFLGEVGLREVHLEARRGEIGYWLMPVARGRGAMQRALRLYLAWAFDELGLHRIDWTAMVGNRASRATAEAVGFRYEGTRRRRMHRRYDDTWHDEDVMGLLRSDWDRDAED
jgi:ribosomal-protein-alanine N-acetyltransferase